MFERFRSLKEQTLALAEGVSILREFPELVAASPLDQDLAALRDEKFRIAVVAPFSAGKSTFVNALLGTDLLGMAMKAETAAITFIRYGDEPRIKVTYMDSELEEEGPRGLPPEELKRLMRAITTVRPDEEQKADARKHLRYIDQVAGDSNDEKIRDVIVEWNLPLCQGGVELIDTPGLFSRHPSHNDITARILPQAHAVIFVFEPDNLGEVNFTDEIRRYVQEVKSSSLERTSRHIFFLINKLDRYPELYDQAVQELTDALAGILPNPQIMGVSSYYAMMARRFAAGEITLRDLQRDKVIAISDPDSPGDILAGRLLEEHHVPLILEESKIEAIEGSLGRYLEQRNGYLLENVVRTLQDLYRQALAGVEVELAALERAMKEGRRRYTDSAEQALKEINALQSDLGDVIERIAYTRLSGNSETSTRNRVTAYLRDSKPTVRHEVEDAFIASWLKRRRVVTRKNAEKRLEEVNQEGEHFAQLYLKEVTKHAYSLIEDGVNGAIERMREQFDKFELNYDEVMRSLGNKLDGAQGVNLESMRAAVQRKIESMFSTQVQSVAVKIQQGVAGAISDATTYERKPGLWNWFKSLFGAEEWIEKFDNDQFVQRLDELIPQFANLYSGQIEKLIDQARRTILSDIRGIVDAMNEQAQHAVTYVVGTRKQQINQIKEQLTRSEEEWTARGKELHRQRKLLSRESTRLAPFVDEVAELVSTEEPVGA